MRVRGRKHCNKAVGRLDSRSERGYFIGYKIANVLEIGAGGHRASFCDNS